jgi:hypothetical protein
MLKSLQSRQKLKFLKMKIERKILTIILLSMIIFAGCKKDKKESSFSNYVKYDSKMYPIDKGVLENYGQWEEDGAYNLDLTLFSEGITLLESGGEISGATGKGHGIYLEMYTSSPSQLDNGTYEYDYWSEEAGTFDYGWVTINYDAAIKDAEIDQDIEGGTVTVTKTGDTYEITINCTDEDGKSVTGYYKGTLKYYDYDKKKSTKADKRRF